MRVYFRTRRFLATTTVMTTAFLPTLSLGVGLFAVSTEETLADDPISIPLEYVGQTDSNNQVSYDRLGIWAKINNGKAQRYVFDTGSDQLNTQIGKDVTGVNPVSPRPYVYAYGDGTYGYKLQQVEINRFTYVDPADQSKTIDGPQASDQRYQVARIIDFAYTEQYCKDNNLRCSPETVSRGLNDIFGKPLTEPYFADLDQKAKMDNGDMADEGGQFAGTFGAGDYINYTSAWGMMGSVTRTGYVVSANINPDATKNETPGCSPCTIINLSPGLRAQYTNVMSWGNKDHANVRPQFPGSGANASTEFEGAYNLQIASTNGQGSIPKTGIATLLDTGTPGGGSLYLSPKMFAELQNSKADIKPVQGVDGRYNLSSLTISGANGDPVTLQNIAVNVQSGADDGYIEFVAGLDFFKARSVIFDLEKKSTAYTPYFVTASNFSTDASAAEGAPLNRITAQMGSQFVNDQNGNEGWLGIAGVISGSGSLTLDPYTNVRMTNINTYTGETIISRDGWLSLAGLGNIEQSARVVAEGTLDISEHGNGSDYWGISDEFNDARIRSLSGGGTIKLGERTLVLTAANDAFAGSIDDLGLDDQNQEKHWGGGLLVAGGRQELSGNNNYTGMTTVASGAGLLLADTGSITHDVTTAGFLGNDGQIGGGAQAIDGGVVAGAGIYGVVTVGNGGAVAPGSALDANREVAALTVTGDFRQASGSIYQAGLSQSSDLIDVGGSAIIDSGAKVELLRQGTPSIDTRYTLLSATGPVNGTYGGLTGVLATDSPFVDFALAYDARNVYLDTSRTSTSFAEVGATFNQRSVATASQALGGGNPIYDNILFLTTPEARNAFDMLSGEIHASTHSALIEDSHFVRDAAGDRIRAAFDGVGASSVPVMAYGPGGSELVPATSDKFGVWGRGFGAWGHLDGDGNAARLDRSTGGFLAGGDTAVGENGRLGMLAGYSHTSFDVDDRASSGSSDNYHLGVYAGAQHGNLGFRSGLAYTWHRIETERFVVVPGFSDSLSTDYDAGTFQAFGELGYRIDTVSASFEPYANLAYVNFDADGFTEKGGAAALSSGGQSSDTTYTTLGLRASTELTFGTVNATARGGLGWRYAFGDIRPETGLAFAGGSSFAIEGAPIAKNAALLEAGLDVNITENATLGIAYQGQIASDAQEHGFNARLGVRF